MLTALASVVLTASTAVAKILYAGVNESGGEFGVYSANDTIGTGLPGEFGVTYAFINESTVDVFLKDGVNLFRVAFLMERMCPLAYGLGSKFNETYFTEYSNAINYITGKGAYAIIDPHNYMRYGNPNQQPTSGPVIGSGTKGAATTAQFKTFYAELAKRFLSNEKVIFSANNEPHDMPTPLVLKNDQAVIDAVRGVGGKQLILAPGNGYTGGHSWNQTTGSGNFAPSSEYLYKISDPLNNTAIEIHEYLDYDFSGTHQVCNQSGPANLEYLTGWLRQHNLKAIVDEFGADNNAQCHTYVKGLLNYLSSNSDVYIGWAAWAAGPLWGTNAACCNDGAAIGSLEPGTTGANGQPSQYYSVWLDFVQPLLPKTLKKSGTSTV